MLLDIRPDHLRMVLDILQKHVPQYEVWAFGSRAKWTAKDYSDLDLCIVSDQPLSFSLLGALAEDFSDSDLPWKVDVVDWATVSESFRKIIARDKVVVQRGGMAGEWQHSTLGEFVSLQRGHDLTEPERKPGTVPVMGSAGQNGFHDTALAKGPGIVIGRSGASFGQVHYCPVDYWPHNTTLYVTDFHGNDPQFAYYFLKSINFARYNSGSAQPSLNRNFIYPIEVNVPQFNEQRAIAHILGTLDDKIELNRRMNETLEAIARAMFKSWFVDFDPVRAKASGEAPESICRRLGLTPDLLALFPDRLMDSELGDGSTSLTTGIPAGWGIGTVDSEFNLTMGQSPPGSTYNETGEGLPFYQGRTDFGFRFPTQRVFCTEPTRFANIGDTLISVRAPVGDINMAAERCCIGRGVAAARHKTGSRSYTYHFMQALKDVFCTFEADGTVFGSISKKDFHNIQRLVPAAQVITAFDSSVAPMDAKVFVCEQETRSLAVIRDALLPKLLSGELRVPDAEKALEA